MLEKNVFERSEPPGADYCAGRLNEQQCSFKKDRLSPRGRSACDGAAARLEECLIVAL